MANNNFVNNLLGRFNFGGVAAKAEAMLPMAKAKLEKDAASLTARLEKEMTVSLANAKLQPVATGAERVTFIVPLIGYDKAKSFGSWFEAALTGRELDALIFSSAYRCAPEALTAEGRKLAKPFSDDEWLSTEKGGFQIGGRALRHHLVVEADRVVGLAEPLAQLVSAVDAKEYSYLVIDAWVSLEARKGSAYWAFEDNGKSRPLTAEELQGEVKGLFVRNRISRIEGIRLVRLGAEVSVSTMADDLKGVTGIGGRGVTGDEDVTPSGVTAAAAATAMPQIGGITGASAGSSGLAARLRR